MASPSGIFLETGTWFSITEDALEKYARGVVRKYPLGRLLSDADVWLRAPRTMAVVVLPVLLLLTPVWFAIVSTLFVYTVTYLFGPSLVNIPMLVILRALENVAVQAILYIVILSYLAMNGEVAAMWAGLVAFVLFRWGLIGRAADRLLSRPIRKLYSLPLPDQILRGVVLRHAIRLKVAMPEFADMERSIRNRWV